MSKKLKPKNAADYENMPKRDLRNILGISNKYSKRQMIEMIGETDPEGDEEIQNSETGA